jgi:tRNA threonylcarbamoyladenosine biosynthesis protein TsaB
MLILAVDTSGKNGSLALVRFEGEIGHTLELLLLEGGAFSAQLIPQISALLAKQSLSKHQIDGFSVVSGPGSFTGLRVGLAAIKASAEILQKPIAAVSLLEVVARAAGTRGRMIAALDAGRGDVYAGAYEFGADQACDPLEELLTIAELRAKVASRAVITPDQALAGRLEADGLKVTLIPHPRADAVAALGFEKIRNGEVVSPEALDATYIRRTDAEILQSRKISG